MKTCTAFALIPTLLPQGEGLKTPLLREVRRKQEKVQWTFSPLNGRRRFFCARAGSRGEGRGMKQSPVILLGTLRAILNAQCFAQEPISGSDS